MMPQISSSSLLSTIIIIIMIITNIFNVIVMVAVDGHIINNNNDNFNNDDNNNNIDSFVVVHFNVNNSIMNPLTIMTTSVTTSYIKNENFFIYNFWNRLTSLSSSSLFDKNFNYHRYIDGDKKNDNNNDHDEKWRKSYKSKNTNTHRLPRHIQSLNIVFNDIDNNHDNDSLNEDYNNYVDHQNWLNYDYNTSDDNVNNDIENNSNNNNNNNNNIIDSGIDFRIPHMHNITFLLNVSRDIPEKLRIILFGYILPNLFALTIITNLLIVAILSKQHMRTPTNLVLLGMAISDLLTLLIPSPWYIYLFTMGHHKESIYPVYKCYIFHWMYEALPPLFHTYSIWLTLLLAGQRYIYVCHFSLARRWCTVPQVIRAMLILLSIAILHQSTRFFDRIFLPVKYVLDGKIFNGCEYHTSEWVLKYFGEDLYYLFYYGFRIIFVHTGPCIILVWLNVLLFQALHRTRKTRKRLLSSSSSRPAAATTTTMATAGPSTSFVTMMMMANNNTSDRRSNGSIHINIHTSNHPNHNPKSNALINENETNALSIDHAYIDNDYDCVHQTVSIKMIDTNHNKKQIIDCDINDLNDYDENTNFGIDENQNRTGIDNSNHHDNNDKHKKHNKLTNNLVLFNRFDFSPSIHHENSSIKLTHQMIDTNKIRMNRLDSRSTTVMLIVIVSMFLFLEIPFALTTIVHVVQSAFQIEIVNYSVLNSIIMLNNFFIIVSYPINFAIYCGMSRQFRITFHQSILAPSCKHLQWLTLKFYPLKIFRHNNNKSTSSSIKKAANNPNNNNNVDNNSNNKIDSSENDPDLIDKSYLSAADLAEKRIDDSELLATSNVNEIPDLNNLINYLPKNNDCEINDKHENSDNQKQ